MITGVPADAAMSLRGDVRPGRRNRALHVRGRGGPRRERHALRARRVLLQPRHRPNLARLGGARVRDPRHQHRRHLDRGRAVRRRQGVGHRPRGLEVRDRRVARDQVPLHGRESTVIVEQRDYHVPRQAERGRAALRDGGDRAPAAAPRQADRRVHDRRRRALDLHDTSGATRATPSARSVERSSRQTSAGKRSSRKSSR